MAIDRETQVLAAAYAGGIRSPKELANFMAQVTHESNGLNRLDESFRYLRGVAQIPAQAAWREGPQVLESARKDALRGHPERLAELMYGSRNGNDQPGDGFRYHGRGYLPVPGKDHYRAAGAALGLDLVDKPELAGHPEHAAKIAVWYWRNRVPDTAREDVKAATQALNGKLYGLDDRRVRFDTWERRLTPDLMQRLDDGHGRHLSATTGDAIEEIASASELASRQANRSVDARKSARKKAQDDLTSTQNLLSANEDMTDPVLMYEMQRDVMEATTEYVAEPPRHARHRHHHHGAYACAVPPPSLHQASHPHHALFTQARDAVHRLDATHQRSPDERSDRLAAALTAAAHGQGLQRIDHVTLSDDASRTFAVQGELHSPHKQVAEVKTALALDTPVEKSAEALATHDRPAPIEATQPPHPALKPPSGH